LFVASHQHSRGRYPYNPEIPGGCWEYHAGKELIARSEKKPLKVLLFVSYGGLLPSGVVYYHCC
jgi:hypothetical protein